MGEHEIQTYILELLRPLIERYLARRRVRAHVGSDQYIYWRQFDPTKCLAPGIYLLPGVPQDIAIDVWKIWERGIVPSFALEVVGRDRYKDYEQSPGRYAELGTKELVIFDPFPSATRRVFQLYRRVQRRFRLIEASDGDRVRSRELGCFLRVVGSGAATRLRIAEGFAGDDLFPTAEEAQAQAEAALVAAQAEAEAAHAEAEAARAKAEAKAEAAQAEAEAERSAKEAERSAKEAALRRLADLEAKLARRAR